VSSIHVVAIGAPGGNADTDFPGGAGGNGAKATADLAVTPGETLYIEVGGPGGTTTGFTGGAGGFNGGRPGGSGFNNGAGFYGGGGGGGASDVRTLPAKDGLSSLNSRVIIAAGGGGGGGQENTNTSTDGGAAGQPGSPGSACGGATGKGCGGGAGKANAGGSGGAGDPANGCTAGGDGTLGVGGAGGGGDTCTGGGGGGGGLNGGGGGGAGDEGSFLYAGGGGGGSSGFGSATTNTSVGAVMTGTAPSITFKFTVHQPDAQIKLASDTSYLGAGVFNLTGAGQTRATTTAPGKSATFNLRLANAGSASDSIGVLGCTGSTAFKPQYFQGTTDVTSAVTAGSYNTGTLAVGAAKVLKLKIAVSSTAATGKVFTCAVLASSHAVPSHRDVVKAKVKVG
jgi:hypothetical protein